jgi:hypothetical protein
MVWDPLVATPTTRPYFSLLDRAYGDYRTDSAPCKAPGIDDQCAVRLSVALWRCGLGLQGFRDQGRVHRNWPRCHLAVAHVVGAQELAQYLAEALGVPQRFNASEAVAARNALAGQRGIVFFKNCFRSGGRGGPKTGDHIDIFNGKDYFNELLHVSAGGGTSASTDLFGTAEQVWFFPLS